MGSTPTGISGSRAAAILGMSPWSTPFQTWQDMMEALKPGFNAANKFDYEAFEGNAATRWGLGFEDAIVKLAEEKVEQKIFDRERAESLDRKGLGYITCHVDGIYEFKPGQEMILHEGKTTTLFSYDDKWGEPGSDKIPVEYQIQVQHQMLCTGADECIVSVLVFPKRPDDWEETGITIEEGCIWFPPPEGGDLKQAASIIKWASVLDEMGFFHQYVIKSNKDLQVLMLDKYKEWWQKYVIGETPPEPADYADIRAMITSPTGTIIVNDEIARWFKEFKDIGGEIGKGGNLSKRRDQLKTFILDHARALESTIDDESTDKWVFRDGQGNKLGSYGRTKAGYMAFK